MDTLISSAQDAAGMRNIRSMLFIPALKPQYAQKGLASNASAFILDLEDSIGPGQKDEARRALPDMVAALHGSEKAIFVRVNASCDEDLRAVSRLKIAGVIIPKVESLETLEHTSKVLAELGSDLPLLPSIESPRGLAIVHDIARFPKSIAIMYGAADLVLSAGISSAPEILRIPAMMASLAASANGLPAFGLASMIDEYRDLPRLRQLALEARALGFAGSPAIHPAQLDVLEAAFGPTPEEVELALTVIAAYESHDGSAFELDGLLIERPSYLRALEIAKTTPAIDPAGKL